MFNKAKKEWKKEISSYKKERRSKLYNGWDIGEMGDYTIIRDGVVYYYEKPARYVIDSYDDAIGSVELSHHESLGYSIIKGYKGDTDTLDFTFARPQDEIRVKCDDGIKNIKLNASHLRYATIKCSHPLDIKVVVDTGKIDRWRGLQVFVKNNKEIIKSISFVDHKSQINDMLSDAESKTDNDNKIK